MLQVEGDGVILKQVNDNRKIFRDMVMNKWGESLMTDLKRVCVSESIRPTEGCWKPAVKKHSLRFPMHSLRAENGSWR